MGLKVIIYGTVDRQGKVNLYKRDKLTTAAREFFPGEDIQITMERRQVNKSAEQNRLWWAYVTILAKELGYHKDEMHSICKAKFLKHEIVIEQTGEVIQYDGSTKGMGKRDFYELTEEIIQWAAADLGIALPLPDEQQSFDYT